jgi:hypothetical protein
MRGGALPPAILCVALGLALASTDRRVAIAGVLVLAMTASAVAFAPLPPSWTDAAFLGCWLSVAINSSIVYVPGGLGSDTALAISFNSGIWAGAVLALAASRRDLIIALLWSLSVLPAGWTYRRHQWIVLKVVASWLIAIAVLAGALQFLSVTPGYLPDHME